MSWRIFPKRSHTLNLKLNQKDVLLLYRRDQVQRSPHLAPPPLFSANTLYSKYGSYLFLKEERQTLTVLYIMEHQPQVLSISD